LVGFLSFEERQQKRSHEQTDRGSAQIVMETFRGRELGVAAAEAFVALARDSRSGRLPGL
jgi:hypothetical protein